MQYHYYNAHIIRTRDPLFLKKKKKKNDIFIVMSNA